MWRRLKKLGAKELTQKGRNLLHLNLFESESDIKE
jgi:hypothetical protein